MNRPRRPAPEPLEVDVVSVVTVGTALWFVAFVVLLPLRGRLAGAGHHDWVWTCLAGWTLGLLGIAVARAQRAARLRAQVAGRQGGEHVDRVDRAGDAGRPGDHVDHRDSAPDGHGGPGTRDVPEHRHDRNAGPGRHGNGRTG